MAVTEQLTELGRRIAERENEIKGLRGKIETLNSLKEKLQKAKVECEYMQNDNLRFVRNIENEDDNLGAVYIYCEEQHGYLKGGIYMASIIACEDMMHRIDEKVDWYESEIHGLHASISRMNSEMDIVRLQMQDMEGI